MAKLVFQTLSDELEDCALAAHRHFDRMGYSFRVEPSELGFPSTPAFIAKRQKTRVVGLISSQLERSLISNWVGYCKTDDADIRLAVLVPSPNALRGDEETWLKSIGVGLYVLGESELAERIPPKDLPAPIHLPDIADLPKRIRAKVAPIYEKEAAGQWHDAFEEGCRILETEGRKHLRKGCKVGRLQFVRNGKQYSLTDRIIEKMTMGALAHAFDDIITRTRIDDVFGRTLKLINDDRVGVVHHRNKSDVEKRLRRTAGNHLWTIIGLLKALPQ